MDHILKKLSRELPGFSPQLSRAARLVLDNPGTVAVSSMRGLAQEAKVSPPTMLRLAQRMGFEGYEEFRDVFKSSLTRDRYGERAQNLRESVGEEGVPGVVAKTAAAAVDSIRQFGEPPFIEDIEQVAEMLMDADKIHLVGVSAMHGLASSFQYVCRMVLPNMAVASVGGSTPIDGLVTVRPNDAILAISIAPYARGTVLALKFAKEKGAKAAAITDRRSSPLARHADVSVIVNTVSPHYFPTLISTTAALEALSAAIAVKGGAEAVEAIADYDTAMRANRFYWEDET